MDLATLNVLAFALNMAASYASGQGYFGKDIPEVSADHPTFVTPAGYAFSIWGVISSTEAVFVAWQATFARRSPIVTKGVGPWFATACVLQALWVVAFTQEYIALSAGILIGIAMSLGIAVIGLAPFKDDISTSFWGLEGWLVHFPIGLHAGWTCAAALVNVNMLIDSEPLSDKVGALIITVVVACMAAVLAAVSYSSPVYLGAIAWALAGIANETELRSRSLPPDMATGVNEALAGSCLVLVIIGFVTSVTLIDVY